MALDLSKLNIFSRLDARSRVFVLLVGVAGVVLVIYLITKYFVGAGGALGPSAVANAPAGLQSVPGISQSAMYNKAIEQANQQRVQQAQVSGGSSVPTVINMPQVSGEGQCVICSEQNVNVKDTLDSWVQSGKITPETAKILSALAAQNVSPNEFAAKLNELVAQGKITPEQARILLDQYKKQHANALAQESAKVMDDLIKKGQLPLDAANELLALQKQGVSTTDYAAKLQELVAEGKISPATAQKLLAQYTQQMAKEQTAAGIAAIRQMAASGQLTPDTAKELIDLQNRNVPVDEYKQALDRLVAEGKITPAVAKKLLEDYQKQKGAIGPNATANAMLKKAEDAAYGEINDLMKAGKMTPEVGAQLTALLQKDVSLNEYHQQLMALVQQNKLSPDIAKLKYDDYVTVKGLRDAAIQLAKLQGNNVSAADYEAALKALVQKGAITPEQAAELMQEYQAVKAQAVTPIAAAGAPATEAFAQLQARLQQGAAANQNQPTTATPEEFAASQVQAQQVTAQDEEQKIQTLMGQMSGQAQQLVTSWQTVPMVHKEGDYATEKEKAKAAANAAAVGASGEAKNAAASIGTAPSLIKAGTIIFAVLDTAVNSDYPDSPVMATIVDGKYKGAKLLGKLQTTKGVSGQLDRVMLNFTLMNMDVWPKSKGVTAYAIDPDTARTVLASNVNYHYLQRFGAIMATSFVQGYANAIASSASTTTTGIFGTSTTHPSLSPSQKMATAIGQIGTALGNVTQNYTNIPPTVKVDSGVGLGILFMTDVT